MTQSHDQRSGPAAPVWIEVEAELRPLVELYLSRKNDELPDLQRAVDAADFPLVRRIGHNIKGSGGAYGLPQLSILGAQMEEAALAGDGEAVRAAAAAIENLVQAARLR